MLKLKKLIESNVSVAPPDIDIRRPIAGKDIDYEGPEKSYEIALDFNDDHDMFHKLYVMYKTKMNKLQRDFLKTNDIEIENGTLKDDESGGIIGIKELWVEVEEGNSGEVELFCSIVKDLGGFNDAQISAEDNDFPQSILPAFEELHKKQDITVSEGSIWIAPAECTSGLLYTILRELHSLRTGLNEEEIGELTDKTYVAAAQKATGQRRTGQSEKFASVLFKKYFDQRIFFLEPLNRGSASFPEVFGLAIEADSGGFRIENDVLEVFFSMWEFNHQYKEERVPKKFMLKYPFKEDELLFSYENHRDAPIQKIFRVTRKTAMFLSSVAKAFNPQSKINVNIFTLIERFSNPKVVELAHTEEEGKPTTTIEGKTGAEYRAMSNKIKAGRFQTPQDAGIKKHDARSSEMEMKYEFIKTVRDRFQPGSKDYKTCDDILEYCIDRMAVPTTAQQDLLIRLYMKAA